MKKSNEKIKLSAVICCMLTLMTFINISLPTFAATTLKSPFVKSAKAKSSSSITITWGKVSGAKGYVIRQKIGNGKFKKVKTITNGNTTSATITNLKSGTNYSYKMKAYTIRDGVKVFGKNSNVKSAKTKMVVIGLDKLPVVDYAHDFLQSYEYCNEGVTDTFGNSYRGYHYFSAGDNTYAIFNLNKQYKVFSFDVVYEKNNYYNAKADINVYVDGKLKYSLNEYSLTTGKKHKNINVTNGKLLEIKVSSLDWCNAHIAFVNAKVKK